MSKVRKCLKVSYLRKCLKCPFYVAENKEVHCVGIWGGAPLGNESEKFWEGGVNIHCYSLKTINLYYIIFYYHKLVLKYKK
jgi:hypothetical protein